LIITAVISFILAMLLIQSPSGYEGSPVPTETVTATETITETAAPTEEATKAPPTAKPTKAPPTEKALTRAQEQAIGTAKDYLDNGHFSRSGLIDQLKYEGYSKAVATFAVDYLKINWNKQAVGTAKDYLANGHFSRSGLIDQLEYEGYTHSQAVYGVGKAY
jgi:hypothetical protein